MNDRSITAHELAVKLATAHRPLVIDVRKAADFAAAATKIPTASWYDPDRIEGWAKELPRGTPIVVYCVKGAQVCRTAASYLSNAGFDASILEGGIRAWEESRVGMEPPA